jgi:hypothetical protein
MLAPSTAFLSFPSAFLAMPSHEEECMSRNKNSGRLGPVILVALVSILLLAPGVWAQSSYKTLCPQIFAPQRDLAIETLRLEIETYRPKLVVFLTGDWADCWVIELVGDPDKAPWHKARTCWWCERTAKRPAMLWTRRHPRGVTRAQRRAWLRRAKQLTA